MESTATPSSVDIGAIHQNPANNRHSSNSHGSLEREAERLAIVDVAAHVCELRISAAEFVPSSPPSRSGPQEIAKSPTPAWPAPSSTVDFSKSLGTPTMDVSSLWSSMLTTPVSPAVIAGAADDWPTDTGRTRLGYTAGFMDRAEPAVVDHPLFSPVVAKPDCDLTTPDNDQTFDAFVVDLTRNLLSLTEDQEGDTNTTKTTRSSTVQTDEQYTQPPVVDEPALSSSVSSASDSCEPESMSALQLLEAVFQDRPQEDINRLLEDSNYDVEVVFSAITGLVLNASSAQGNGTDDTDDSNEQRLRRREASKPRGSQICRHFLDGGCFRSDCWYSHDLDAFLCKFWVRGQCLNPHCPFLHGVDEEVAARFLSNALDEERDMEARARRQREQQAQRPLDMSEFPDLASSNTVSTSGGKQSRTAGSKRTSAATPTTPTVDFALALRQPPTASSSTTTASSMPVRDLSFSASSDDDNNTASWYAHGDSRYRARSLANPSIPYRQVALPRLPTGDAVAELYRNYRREATTHYRMRSAYLQRARDAYRQGRYTAAKRFSLLGQGHNAEMTKFHRMAAEQIFAARNQRGRDAIIDLHGLHIDEAIYFLDARLWDLEAENAKRCFVFSGAGKHSMGRAKLLPAVINYLIAEELRFADCSPDRQGGMLIVEWD